MTSRKLHRSAALPQRQRGAVIVLIVIALTAILMMSALALDGGHMLVNKTRLQNAVDAAALSGAKTLSQLVGGDPLTLEAQSRAAALQAIDLNAIAAGNGELAGASSLAVVTFSESVYGPFYLAAPANARYVRVTVADFPLVGFFWGMLQMFGSDADKAVAAVATAGPSPSVNPCDLSPLMVCGDPDDYDPDSGSFWGYGFGDVEVLKGSSGSEPAIGPGNFQLIDLEGSGKNTVRDALAGGIEKCLGEMVATEPGAGSGPTAQGLNTRFGEYLGEMQGEEDQYPPDVVVTENDPQFEALEDRTVTHDDLVVNSNNGDLSTSSNPDLYDYNDWVADSAACINCSGELERRVMKIVVGDCTNATGGKQNLPVLGYGCFFVLQKVSNSQGGGGNGGGGNKGGGSGASSAEIFGQFIKECDGDGVAGPTPTEDVGPQIIQLYKTYLDSGAPSTDS